MLVKKSIVGGTYINLMEYILPKCDIIALKKCYCQRKEGMSEIQRTVLSVSNYSESDILKRYSDSFLDDIYNQFKDEIAKEFNKKNFEHLDRNNQAIVIKNSIMWLIYESVFNSWIYKYQKHIIFEKDHIIKEGYLSKKIRHSTTYYLEPVFELKNELLNRKSIYNFIFPTSLEDLCIFKDEYCWLYSVAHEKICDIYCENEEEYNYLRSIGIEFEEDYFIPLSEKEKKNLYYEIFNNN